MSSQQKILAAIAALVIVTILGAFGWSQIRKVSTGNEVTELATDSSRRLKEALEIRADPARAGRPDTLPVLEAHVAALAEHQARFQRLDVSRIRMLGYAAGEYISAVNGVVRVQTSAQKMHAQLNEATQVLIAHFGTAGLRRGDWIQEALRRKDRLDQVNSEYRRTVEAYQTLLADFGDVQAQLVRELGPGVATNRALIERARKSAQDEAARAAESVARAKQLAVTR